MIQLLPDQSETIEAVADEMRAGCKAILLQAPTGSGKSVMGSEILRRAREKRKRVWFTVPRRTLIHQMHETFNEFSIEHSYIAADMPLNPHAPAHICSTETLRRRLDKLTPPDLALIDETHFGGEGLDTLIKWLKGNGSWIVGLSATPWKLSGQGLRCWYDKMVCGPSIRELIDLGRLSDYRPFAPSSVDLSRISIVSGDYSKGQLAQKMENDLVLVGNAVNHYKEHARGKRNIAYCVSIAHSQIVAEAFRAGGVSAMHIDGETPDHERRQIIRAFAKREIEVLTNCELLTFGFDLASQIADLIKSGVIDVNSCTIESMSDLRPTKSLALQMQKWGRVLRKKNFPALIFDHANNFKEHGFPCDERHWTLEDRVQGKGGGSRASPVRLCPSCFFCHSPAPRCPDCGYEYPVEEQRIVVAEGELRELEIRRQIAEQKEKKQKRMQIGMAKTLKDLRAIRDERGYDDGWVTRMARIKDIKA